MYPRIIERNHWLEMRLKTECRARHDIHHNLRGRQPNLQTLTKAIETSYCYPVSSFAFFRSFHLWSNICHVIRRPGRPLVFPIIPDIKSEFIKPSATSCFGNVSSVGLSEQPPLLRYLPKCSSRIVVRFLYNLHRILLNDKSSQNIAQR